MRQDPMVWVEAERILFPVGSDLNYKLTIATWCYLGTVVEMQPLHPYHQPPHPFEDMADAADVGLSQALEAVFQCQIHG